MRESIGGAWLFGIVITFIFLFSGFLAYSISYTRAFNLKNEIINYIEQAEGYTTYKDGNVEEITDFSNEKSVEAKVFYLIKKMGYNYEISSTVDCGTNEDSQSNNRPGGYCVYKMCKYGDRTSNTQYKVTTFIALEIPVIGFIVKIPISGETRTIYYDNSGWGCYDKTFEEVGP